jgi:hypothetical protein
MHTWWLSLLIDGSSGAGVNNIQSGREIGSKFSSAFGLSGMDRYLDGD